MKIGEIIASQLGGTRKLNAMTGAYNFMLLENGLSFRLKNPSANYVKIELNGKDLYDVEIGRVRGGSYKIVHEYHDIYNDQLKEVIEMGTGMYLSLEDGGVFGAGHFEDGGAFGAGHFSSGGVTYFNDDNSFRLARASSIGTFEPKIFEKVENRVDEESFVGNFNWRADKDRMVSGYLYRLDELDQNLINNLKVKQGEKVFRYVTRTTAISGMMPFVKINIEKGLLYFPITNDNDDVVFETKGVKASYINLIEGSFADGGAFGAGHFADGSFMNNVYADGGSMEGKNGYIAFYNEKQMEVYADTSLEARDKAAKMFKAKKPYMVTVVLAEKGGKQVTHTPSFSEGGAFGAGHFADGGVFDSIFPSGTEVISGVYRTTIGIIAVTDVKNINGYDWHIITKLPYYEGGLITWAYAGKFNAGKLQPLNNYHYKAKGDPLIKLYEDKKEPMRNSEKKVVAQHLLALEIFEDKMQKKSFADGGAFGAGHFAEGGGVEDEYKGTIIDDSISYIVKQLPYRYQIENTWLGLSVYSNKEGIIALKNLLYFKYNVDSSIHGLDQMGLKELKIPSGQDVGYFYANGGAFGAGHFAEGGMMFNPQTATFFVKDNDGKVLLKTKSLNKASDYTVIHKNNLSPIYIEAVDANGIVKKVYSNGGDFGAGHFADGGNVSNKNYVIVENKDVAYFKKMLKKIRVESVHSEDVSDPQFNKYQTHFYFSNEKDKERAFYYYFGLYADGGAFGAGHFAEGGDINAFTMQMVKGTGNISTEVITEERKISFEDGGAFGAGHFAKGGELENINFNFTVDKWGGFEIGDGEYFTEDLKSLFDSKPEFFIKTEKIGDYYETTFIPNPFNTKDLSEVKDKDLLSMYKNSETYKTTKSDILKTLQDENQIGIFNVVPSKKTNKIEIGDMAWYGLGLNAIGVNSTMPFKESPKYKELEMLYKKHGSKSYGKYTPHGKIKTVTIKKGGKELTYKVEDVYNGVYVLENGGGLKEKAFYTKKADVVKVTLNDGSEVKPVNGFWIKKTAEPIDLKMTKSRDIKFLTTTVKVYDLAKKEGLTYEKLGNEELEQQILQALVAALVDANFHSEAKEMVAKLEGEPWSDKLYKSIYFKPSEKVGNFGRSVAALCEWDGISILNDFYYISKMEGNKAASFIEKFTSTLEFENGGAFGAGHFAMGGLTPITKNSLPKENVLYNFSKVGLDGSVKRELVGYIFYNQNIGGMPVFVSENGDDLDYFELSKTGFTHYKQKGDSKNENKSFAMGGKVTFDEKSAAIAKNFVGKSVEPKYQSEYGETYSKEEASEVGDKIAGAQRAKYESKPKPIAKKKASGGLVIGNPKMKAANDLAKQIRKDGEKWSDALKRAHIQLKG
jgi:hypothetical protein